MAKRHTKKKHSMKKAKTRRSHVMSIPQLRAAFEKINKEARAMLSSMTPASAAPKFQKLWQSVFHKHITEPAAKAYLMMLKPTRKQHGGAMGMDGVSESAPGSAIWGDGQLRPGIDAQPVLPPTPQGAFYQNYVGNPGYPGSAVPEPSFGGPAGCAKQAGGLRRNRNRNYTRKMRGGAYLPTPADFLSSYSSHPYVSQNPQTAIGDMARMWNGQAIAPPMDVTKTAPPYLSAATRMTMPNTVAPFGRSLWSDIAGR